MKTAILGVKIDNLDFKAVMAEITRFLNKDGLHQIATINPEFVMAAQKDAEFKNILNNVDLAVPDGIGLQWAAKFLRLKIGERLTGVDLTWEIAKLAAEGGYSIYLLGAKEGIAAQAAQKLKIVYPNLTIAGVYAGKPDEKGLVSQINQTKADILLVAFGAPKQEKFIYENHHKLTVKLAMGVGGTFDYIAGAATRAPKWIRTLGLEWLYRLICQPRRLGRIITATILFPLAVLRSKYIK